VIDRIPKATAYYGLIGKPLGHSISATYFNKKFKVGGIKARYELYELNQVVQVRDLMRQVENLKGLNVTVPFKTDIIPLLKDIDPVALAIGAVNCIKIEEGKMKGFNTDAPAFWETIQPLLLPHHRQALILGTGGSAKAVKYALEKGGIACKTVSRSSKGDLTYENLKSVDISDFSVVINCTPMGMYPHIDTYPTFPMAVLNDRWLVYDLVYNPDKTHFLKGAAKRGAVIKNGMDMLISQAELSWQIWSDMDI
jgi:shikimate dehydrogenase